jgi:hypothetical protein
MHGLLVTTFFMEEDTRPSETVPEGSDVKPAEGDEKVSVESQVGADNLSLEELNSALGRSFKTKDGAIKAIKDTYSYVGKAKEPPQATALANSEIQELRNELFFTQQPDYKDARPILEALAKANGQTIQEAAESQLFKDTFSKIKGFDESQSKKTVMETSGRIPAPDTAKEFSDALGNKEKSADLVLKQLGIK